MPSRYYKRNFIKGYYYHIYNRGANKEIIFRDDKDCNIFIDILAYYLTFPMGKPLSILNRINASNNKNKVRNLVEKSTSELCAYCLMPNHFHLLLKQVADPIKGNSITNLMRRVIITYAMFIQKKYDHSGILFQGKFKNVLVSSDIQLLQLSKYIHRNPLEIQGSEPLQNYKYSSYKYYIEKGNCPAWLKTKNILSFFPKTNTNKAYRDFIEEKPTQIESDIIKNIILE